MAERVSLYIEDDLWTTVWSHGGMSTVDPNWQSHLIALVEKIRDDSRLQPDQLPRLAQVWPEMAQRLADLIRHLDERPTEDAAIALE